VTGLLSSIRNTWPPPPPNGRTNKISVEWLEADLDEAFANEATDCTAARSRSLIGHSGSRGVGRTGGTSRVWANYDIRMSSKDAAGSPKFGIEENTTLFALVRSLRQARVRSEWVSSEVAY